jgi:integrative and conjugative element protein (TIGR02256 family)
MFVTDNDMDNFPNIVISNSVKAIFTKFRQIKNNNLEACGILIGNHKTNGNIYVKYATIPQIADIRKRYSFKINPKAHQDILENYFIESNYEDVYLGTWHSHPESNPTPSSVDIEDWKKQYQVNKKIFSRMIFAIIGTKQVNFWQIKNEHLNLLSKGRIKYE